MVRHHSRPQSLRSFWPAAGIESSGSNHFEITKEITEFCPSGLTRSSSMAHARNGCSQSSRFLPQARRIVGSGDENANVTAVDRELFPVPGCHNPLFSIDKDSRKRTLHNLMKEYAKFLVKGLDVHSEELSHKSPRVKVMLEGFLVIILEPSLICRIESNSRTIYSTAREHTLMTYTKLTSSSKKLSWKEERTASAMNVKKLKDTKTKKKNQENKRS